MKRNVLIIFIIFIIAGPLTAEEGMYPLSELEKLNLTAEGFQLKSTDIYNPNGISLTDAIINLSGCTASFISPTGLVLTNHHCALRAIQQASSRENDYMTHGFIARSPEEEIEAKGYTVRIIDSYKDVSKEVLKVVRKRMNFSQRAKAIAKRMKEIVNDIEKKNPGKRADVAEMFRGKTYVLFIYTYLKDIRIVYAPPESVGQYGGQEDNWMWPRHGGDFTILRAYVGPDGKSADYSKENIPYQPKKYLKVAPEGVNEGELVFILGYPGRTYRHTTSYYLGYEEEVRMPRVVTFYQWQISLMEQMIQKKPELSLKLSSAIYGLSNREKNYRGKLKGLKHLHLVKQRKAVEDQIAEFIRTKKKKNKKYIGLFEKFDRFYRKKRENAPFELLLSYLRRNTQMMGTAIMVVEAAHERIKPDTERDRNYMKRNYQRAVSRKLRGLKNFHEPADRTVLAKLLADAVQLKDCERIPAIDKLVEGKDTEKAIGEFIQDIYKNSRLMDRKFLKEALFWTPKQVKEQKDPAIQFALRLYPTLLKYKEDSKKEKGELDYLSNLLLDVKREFLGKGFIPDANSTLRLTYGKIEGYSPADAVYMSPITTLNGVIQKDTGRSPFDLPDKIKDLYHKKDYGKFIHTKLKSVPVDILYSADTTGGNSGSPVLNARGELVGLNFDRAFEATINDFAWNHSYSRSIGVDIRYVLWLIEKMGNATGLLDEMGVCTK